MHRNLVVFCVAFALVAGYLGITFALPPNIGIPVALIAHWLGGIAIVGGVIYGRGSLRAFCVGCAIFAIQTFLRKNWEMFIETQSWGEDDFGDWFFSRYYRSYKVDDVTFVLHYHAFVILSGTSMVVVRWLLGRVGELLEIGNSRNTKMPN